MTHAATTIFWKLYPPPSVTAAAPDWLAELSEMRGRLLYAEGRRPAFRRANGEFADEDALDRDAYHLLAYAATGLVGCVRLVPLAAVARCVTETLTGSQPFHNALLALNASHHQAAECGRWIVAPDYRSTSMLAMRLAAGIIAIGRQLEHKILVASTGTRDGQTNLLMRIGFQPLPHLAPLAVPMYSDELQFIYINPCCASPKFTMLINQMAERLALGSLERLDNSTGAF
ncbi:MAG: GNAT family N-acyltransferase [Caldilineaceae bacterium]